MEQTEIDLKDILAVLHRQRRLIVATVLVLVGAAFLYLMSATPIYQATALIKIENGGSNLLDPNANDAVQSTTMNSVVDSEVEILRSEATALAVIDRMNLISDSEFGPHLGMMEKISQVTGVNPRELIGLDPKPAPTGEELLSGTLQQLQGATDVRRKGLTYLLSVAIASEDPKRAAEIANTMAQVYIERQVATKTRATIAARDVLRRQLETARSELAASEDALNGFIENNLARLEAESGNEAVATLRQQLEAAKEAKLSSQTRIDAANSAIGQQDWSKVAETLGDKALAQLAQQREDIRSRLQEAGADSQEAIDLRAALEGVDKDLAETTQTVLGDLRSEVGGLSDQEKEARDQLRETLLQADLSSDTLADLFNLQQSATVARNQYQLLLSREQDFGAMANLQIADANVVSEALPPSAAAFPNKRLILALAIVAALGLGVGLAFLNEYYIGGITSASQLQNVLQTRVPVSIPSVPPSVDALTPADTLVGSPLSPYAETFRKLRSAVDIAARDAALVRNEQTQLGVVVLLCSALPAEGKSTAALALARTYAESGQDTLLIEADLRKPSLVRYLGLELETPGLLELLQTKDNAKRGPIQPVLDPMSSLMVLPAGGRSNRPTDQMLGSGAFRSIINAARERFAVIVIDSPPLLPVVDTRYLAQVADVVVQVVRYATTTQGEAREAAQQVTEFLRPGVQLMGVLSHELQGVGTGNYYNYRYAGYYSDGSED